MAADFKTARAAEAPMSTMSKKEQIKKLTKKARKGDVLSQYALCNELMDKKEYKSAEKWLKKAIDNKSKNNTPHRQGLAHKKLQELSKLAAGQLYHTLEDAGF